MTLDFEIQNIQKNLEISFEIQNAADFEFQNMFQKNLDFFEIQNSDSKKSWNFELWGKKPKFHNFVEVYPPTHPTPRRQKFKIS